MDGENRRLREVQDIEYLMRCGYPKEYAVKKARENTTTLDLYAKQKEQRMLEKGEKSKLVAGKDGPNWGTEEN